MAEIIWGIGPGLAVLGTTATLWALTGYMAASSRHGPDNRRLARVVARRHNEGKMNK